MSHFPIFLNLHNRKILLVGGGAVAAAKLRHLLEFGSNISVIAPLLADETKRLIEVNNLPLEQRAYKEGDLEGFHLVIVAVDSIALQAEIFKESRGYNCLCNCVDALEYCDFLFGSTIQKDDLTIAISTSGASPAVTKVLKSYFEECIPSDLGVFLQEMKELRQRLPKGKERMHLLQQKAQEYIQKQRRGE